jgi:hypothetical protein
MRPEALQSEIAVAAGVTEIYVGLVLRDYLKSRTHDQNIICKPPTRQTLSVVKDVAVFQADSRLNRAPGGSQTTAKQQALRIAMAEHPRADGEGVMKYCIRVAAIAGVHAGSVQGALDRLKNEAIGTAARAREAEEAKDRLEVMPHGIEQGPVVRFTGWIDTFAKFKALSESYLTLAQTRGDVYARAFLQELRDISDRAQSRAARSKTG